MRCSNTQQDTAPSSGSSRLRQGVAGTLGAARSQACQAIRRENKARYSSNCTTDGHPSCQVDQLDMSLYVCRVLTPVLQT
jgi:hypothetical protein